MGQEWPFLLYPGWRGPGMDLSKPSIMDTRPSPLLVDHLQLPITSHHIKHDAPLRPHHLANPPHMNPSIHLPIMVMCISSAYPRR